MIGSAGLKKIILVILTVLCLAFIWGNSALGGNESSELSGSVLEFISNIIVNLGFKGELSEHIIRKTAHFTEFAVLSTVISFDFYVFKADIKKQWFGILFLGLLTALVDESIQLFSVGRASAVKDVWIDFGGVCVGFIIGMFILNFISKK